MAVKKLLLAFVTTSLLSALANVVGKQNVAASKWLVGVLIVFGLLLHALSYIGYSRNFTIEQYNLDTEEEDGTSIDDQPDDSTLGRGIRILQRPDLLPQFQKKFCGMTPSEWLEKEKNQILHTHLTQATISN